MNVHSFQNNYISVASFGSKTVVPVVGDVVTAKITVINQRFAKCVIICIGKTCLNRPYRGILRKEDVRATEKDRVEMYKCFRPGDIILARVVRTSGLYILDLTVILTSSQF